MRRLLFMLFWAVPAFARDVTLLNVSYDPTRELYAEYNRQFAADWERNTGDHVRIRMSHGGSGKQARAVIDGLQADVVTLALKADIDAIASKGLIDASAQADRIDNPPYASVIVLLVRKGNPKQIHDWGDLTRDGVRILTPNPKTSGGARWNYMAAWAYATHHYPGHEGDFMRSWLRNVRIFDTGARGATTNFVRRRQGDVLITWENEAYIAKKYFGDDAFEVIYPSISVRCEPPVAMVDAVVDPRGTRPLATAYLDGLYQPRAQAMMVRHFFRTSEDFDPEEITATKDLQHQARSTMPPLRGLHLVTVGELGGWSKLQAQHFAEGGLFDQFTARSGR